MLHTEHLLQLCRHRLDQASKIIALFFIAPAPSNAHILDVDSFAKHLRDLHAQRRKAEKQKAKISLGRKALTKAARAEILAKTDDRCHICGGEIECDNWHADHVFAHIKGGKHQEDNYLAADPVCNNLRWHYEAEEFQWILKLGVFMRTQIARKTPIGQSAWREICGS